MSRLRRPRATPEINWARAERDHAGLPEPVQPEQSQAPILTSKKAINRAFTEEYRKRCAAWEEANGSGPVPYEPRMAIKQAVRRDHPEWT
jgi:hypothetical protein